LRFASCHSHFGFRISDFGLPSAFGFRPSDFFIQPNRLPQRRLELPPPPAFRHPLPVCEPFPRRDFLKRAGAATVGLALSGHTGSAADAADAQPAAATPIPPLSAVDRFNYVVGTQTIGASYQFTAQPRLLETALAIRDMGSSVIKLKLAPAKHDGAETEGFQSLRDFAAKDSTIRQILALPFAHYILWAYPAGRKRKANEEAPGRDEELYDLSSYLLRACRGAGKTFYLGHWEGDWELRGRAGSSKDPTPEAISRKIQWLNERQKAVDDAKRDTPHDGVDVFCYAEANLVRDAMKGRPAMANEVIPHTTIDFVSYSSYDTTNQHTAELPEVLDYIESKLPPKPGITGKRVWIGEYGFPAEHYSPEQQDNKAREVMKAGLRWGCPFVLYWEMYNNEVKDGKQRGFWLIDDKNIKQPAYHTHRRLCEWGRRFVAESIKSATHPPAFDEYRDAAVEFLDHLKS